MCSSHVKKSPTNDSKSCRPTRRPSSRSPWSREQRKPSHCIRAKSKQRVKSSTKSTQSQHLRMKIITRSRVPWSTRIVRFMKCRDSMTKVRQCRRPFPERLRLSSILSMSRSYKLLCWLVITCWRSYKWMIHWNLMKLRKSKFKMRRWLTTYSRVWGLSLTAN